MIDGHKRHWLSKRAALAMLVGILVIVVIIALLTGRGTEALVFGVLGVAAIVLGKLYWSLEERESSTLRRWFRDPPFQ